MTEKSSKILKDFALKFGFSEQDVGHAFIVNNEEVSEEILIAADEIWDRKKGVAVEDLNAVVRARHGESTELVLWQGDICKLEVGAIMNAANDQGLGCFRAEHKCIDNVIHRAAGPRLREQCRKLITNRGFDLAGEPLLTDGFHLPANHVGHVVGPCLNRSQTKPNKEQQHELFNAYEAFFQLASANNIRTVATCCLSTGVFRFPNDLACQIALHATKKFLTENPGAFDAVVFDVFLDVDRDLYQTFFPSFFAVDSNLQVAHRALAKAKQVLVVAGAGMSAYPPGGPNVYVDRKAFAKHYPDMIEHGYETAYQAMGLFGDSQLSQAQKWGFWARHMFNMRFDFAPCEAYSLLSQLLIEKDVFVLTSNVDGCFLRSGKPFSKIYTPQGDWSWYQCMKPCSKDSVWPSRPLLDKLISKLNPDGSLPPSAVPSCPKCGGEVFGNVRGSSAFLHTKYDGKQDHLIQWIENITTNDKISTDNNDNFVVLEIGAGFNTPMICRWPAESIAMEKNAILIRVNPDHCEIPAKIEKGISIAGGWQAFFSISKKPNSNSSSSNSSSRNSSSSNSSNSSSGNKFSKVVQAERNDCPDHWKSLLKRLK